MKRATKVFAKAKYQPLISIHALVKRATFYKWDKVEIQGIFQSTPS